MTLGRSRRYDGAGGRLLRGREFVDGQRAELFELRAKKIGRTHRDDHHLSRVEVILRGLQNRLIVNRLDPTYVAVEVVDR